MIFYEEKYAKQLLKNGLSSFMNYIDLSILAKYFRYMGQNKKQIEKSLIEFCKNFNPDFNEILSRGKIERVVKLTDEYGLRFPMDIIVTKDEMNIIKNFGDYNRQKILFVMLVVAKYLKYNDTKLEKKDCEKINDFFVNISFINILKLAKVNVSKMEKKQIIYDLEQSKLIASKRNRKKNRSGIYYRVDFVSEDSDAEIVVKDMEDIISFYPFYCKNCGKKIEKPKRRNICDECYKDRSRNLTKNRVKKYRDKHM